MTPIFFSGHPGIASLHKFCIILNASNRSVYQMDLHSELHYNKPDPANPFFVAF